MKKSFSLYFIAILIWLLPHIAEAGTSTELGFSISSSDTTDVNNRINNRVARSIPKKHIPKLEVSAISEQAPTIMGIIVEGFQGVFAPSNWTFDADGGDGDIEESQAPNSITLIGSDNQSNTANVTTYCIQNPSTDLSTISFDWNYETFDNDGPEWDPFGYTINGNTFQLTDDDGATTQSGSTAVPLGPNQVFCFAAFSVDQLFGRAQTTISNFEFVSFETANVTEEFNNPGTFQWTVPAGVSSILVQAWGGGGGGGPSSGNQGRGGGGGGAYAASVFFVSPGETYTVIVGSGGGPGQDGSSSTFDGGSELLAEGGSQGENSGGAGGQASSSNGSIVFSGGDGGDRSNNSGGGGGGSAFTNADGANGSDASGNTGGTGGSGQGDGGNGGDNEQPGINGQNPGGGGGGRGRNGGASGSGGEGLVVISYNQILPDPIESTITSADGTLLANGLTSTTITVELFADDGINYGFDGEDILITTNAGTLSDGASASSGTSILGFDVGDGTYTATLTSSTIVETATITAYLGPDVSDPIIGTVEVDFTALPPGVFVEIFDEPGSYDWPIPAGVVSVDVLIVGGGGGGGSSTNFNFAGSGGGGAGGYIFLEDLDITGYTNPVPIVVGAGGAPGASGNNSGLNGEDSSFESFIGLGGGGGIGGNGPGNDGGSGGGARGGNGGNALQPSSASGGDGFNGGNSGGSPGQAAASGGGGAGDLGESVAGIEDEDGGNGGPGLENDISGSPQFYAAGGGGGASRTDGLPGTGGSGIGGNGGNDDIAPTQGLDGTGSGGGGGNNSRLGARGGHGIVIIRYFIGDDFYSRTDGSWQDGNTWTFDPSHAGPATTFPPNAGSNVFVAANHEVTLDDNVINNGTVNINDTGLLQTNSFVVSGTGQFNLNAGGALGIISSDGITTSGSTGSIQTTTRNFDEGATYIYNGSTNQFTGNGLPSTVSGLTIDNTETVTLSSSTTVESVLNLENGELIVPSSVTFQIDQNTSGNGVIRIEDGANYLDFSETYPNLSIEREITGNKGWRLISSPVETTFQDLLDGFVSQGFTGSSFPDLQPNILTFDETSIGTTNMAWRQPLDINDSVPSGVGYFQFIFDGAERPDDTIDYLDELPIVMTANGTEHQLNSGVFEFNLTFTERDPDAPQVGDPFIDINENDTGWNLVGNPTASSLFWNNPIAWNRTNVDETIYIWDPTLNDGDFRVSNGVTGNIQDHKIAPFQGFWVRANDENPALTFNQDAKTTDAQWYGRPASENGDLDEDAVIVSLIATAAGMSAETRLMFSNAGSLQHNKKDAYRLNPLADNWLSLTTARVYGGAPLVINSLPKTIEEPLNIPLYLGGSVNQDALNDTFELMWRVPGDWSDRYKLTLMDHELKEAIPMHEITQTSFFHTTASEILPFTRMEQSDSGTQREGKSHEGQFATLDRVLFKGEQQLSMLQTAPEPPRFSVLISPIEEDVSYTPFEVVLNQNYPNPFNPSTTIVFSLPSDQEVRLDVFDILGRRVATLADGTFSSGSHQVTWDARNAASGVYLYRLTTNSKVVTRKMTLVK